VVPVFPAAGRPGLAAVPVPWAMTSSSTRVTSSATAAGMTRRPEPLGQLLSVWPSGNAMEVIAYGRW
jgi:hypothetical protein